MKPKHYLLLIIINLALIFISGNNLLSLKYSYKYDIVKYFFNTELTKLERGSQIANYRTEHKKRMDKSIFIIIAECFTLAILLILKKKNLGSFKIKK